MAPLDSRLRPALEKAILAAREQAEKAATAALATFAVRRSEPFEKQTDDARRLRNALRARARQLGSGSLEVGFSLLVEEVAYEQWHRMLFARFLAENGLLMHPDGVALTIRDCAELAAEAGGTDPWQLAASYAAGMLPGIFGKQDPSVQVRFAPEGQAALETTLAGISPAVFISDDGLGWVYQFWQSKRKKEVSGSGRKIEGLDLAAYSQLFTEDYMVRFLLENSLGAWWAAHRPESPLLKSFEYLRFREDGTPAAGTFPGWPERVAELTVMDPCCGSGHFLVAAFGMLWRMRAEEEGLGEAEAADAVLRDNLFGLEIDPRCVQIAAFALALAAWKTGGYRPLPLPSLACSGIAVGGPVEDWTDLAGDDVNLKDALGRLYQLFRNAPDLGSLIDPANVPLRDRMFTPDFAKVGPLLERALAKGRAAEDPVTAVFGEAARATARAAELLARQYALIATNVPYLGRRDQGSVLREFSLAHYPEAEADLATAFVVRCMTMAARDGSVAVVAPQYWFAQVSYTVLRQKLLRDCTVAHLARLGTRAFRTISGEVVNVALVLLANRCPPVDHALTGIDASDPSAPEGKATQLLSAPLQYVQQQSLLRSADSRISLSDSHRGTLLSKYAWSIQGTTSGDNPRYVRLFWELPLPRAGWDLFHTTVSETNFYGGRELTIYWENGHGSLAASPQARVQGQGAFGKRGVSVKQIGALPCTLYTGEMFDINCATILPKDPAHLAAIWAFCSSPEFSAVVRRFDTSLKVTNASLAKVPFDLAYWQKVADEIGPLPEPHSNDPTQWLFKGNPADSTEPLQVAVARLLGYQWPQQEEDRLSVLAGADEIVPLAPVAGEEPAAERLRVVLATAFGDDWSHATQERLLGQVGFAGKGLDVWLRDGFFEQHCKLFHQRPFIWHIWDGRKDGFSALVNYYKLDAARLDKLIYTYLGDWVRTQRAASEAGTAGAEARLVAALDLQKRLEAIRDGELPYDIYVRWKPIHEQPIGWDPDLNDGVRLNIRPFVTAGVLRSRVNVNWNKDRGLNPDGSERINDRHLTRDEKRAARKAAGR